MRHRIIFKRTTGSKNSGLGSSPTESNVKTVQAAIGRAAMQEGEHAARETAQLTRMFTVRYDTSLDDATLVIEHRGEDYDIEGIENLHGDDAFLQIKAVRRV